MAVQDNSTGPLKIFLWTTPRSASTTFLKCMTYVPDAVAWHEPYLQMGKFCLDGNPMLSGPHNKLLESVGGKSAVAKIESGYDASDKTLDWLKEQLEGEFPGKKLVFVKEIAAIIENQSLHDKIPRGFRHTFLIRHPSKIILSMIKQRQSPGVFKNPNFTLDQLKPTMQFLNKLWQHVKAEGLESCPVIMDADELLANPKEMLEAYCKEVGIPFSEGLLTWPAGDDVMTKHWMVPKQTIATFRVIGFHTSTFASTGFQKQPTNNNVSNQLNSLLPPEWAAVLDEIISEEIPYYEELFAERLIPDKK